MDRGLQQQAAAEMFWQQHVWLGVHTWSMGWLCTCCCVLQLDDSATRWNMVKCGLVGLVVPASSDCGWVTLRESAA